jgi:hypothetical protein
MKTMVLFTSFCVLFACVLFALVCIVRFAGVQPQVDTESRWLAKGEIHGWILLLEEMERNRDILRIGIRLVRTNDLSDIILKQFIHIECVFLDRTFQQLEERNRFSTSLPDNFQIGTSANSTPGMVQFFRTRGSVKIPANAKYCRLQLGCILTTSVIALPDADGAAASHFR